MKRSSERMAEEKELRRLEREFDERFAAMQTKAATRAADELFEMSPRELAEAAIRAAAALRSTDTDAASE